jgi:hypothetical protein
VVVVAVTIRPEVATAAGAGARAAGARVAGVASDAKRPPDFLAGAAA